MNGRRLRRDNRRLAGLMLLGVAGMFGFAFALVPFYNVFCSITGLNGKTADRPTQVSEGRVDERLVTIEFLSNPGTTHGWDFHPETRKLEIHPGQTYLTHFQARNPADRPVVVRAVPSVAPGLAARYLHKTECFCFSNQRFAPGETRRLTLQFMLDPQAPEDLGTLSLAYTLYIQQGADSSLMLVQQAAGGHAVEPISGVTR